MDHTTAKLKTIFFPFDVILAIVLGRSMEEI